MNYFVGPCEQLINSKTKTIEKTARRMKCCDECNRAYYIFEHSTGEIVNYETLTGVFTESACTAEKTPYRRDMAKNPDTGEWMTEAEFNYMCQLVAKDRFQQGIQAVNGVSDDMKHMVLHHLANYMREFSDWLERVKFAMTEYNTYFPLDSRLIEAYNALLPSDPYQLNEKIVKNEDGSYSNRTAG